VLREIYSLIRALLRASGVETKGSSEQATLTWLGTLGDDDQTLIISADGSVVVGWAESADGHQRAFRWTADGGMEDLGTLGGVRVRLRASRQMARWWSAGLKALMDTSAPFAGRLMVGWKTSARWGA